MSTTNCRRFETSIALYVENDLPGTERIAVEQHLDRCADCRTLVVELQSSQLAFKSLRADIPDAAAVAGVRERVEHHLDRIESHPGWTVLRLLFGIVRYKTAVAGLALIVAAGSAVWVGSTLEPPAGPPVLAVVPLPVPPLPIETAEASVVAAPRGRSIPATATETVSPEADPAPEQIVVQLLTDDPDIIIYWLIDAGGD